MRVMVGVDIGGTKIALGRVAQGGDLVGPVAREPSDTRGQAELVEGLTAAVRECAARSRSEGLDVVGVGLGCAGTVDRARGAIVVSPNLPLRDAPLVEVVARAVGLPVFLDNDANVAALAEARAGSARGLRHMAMLTLGTGVGGGLVLDGRLYRGATGAAAELGHTIVAAGGERCRCGARGCLEAYASGTALERAAARLVDTGGVRGGPRLRGGDGGSGGPAAPASIAALARLRAAGDLKGESIARLAFAGDEGASAAVEEVGEWLGVGVANLANMLQPEAVVVGGGLVDLGELLLGPAREVLRHVALSPNRDARLLAAALGADAGVVGAGLLAWEEAEA